jgi:hypothetical protein
MYAHASWLTLDGLLSILRSVGLRHCQLVEERAERNGPRVLIMARREPA